MTREDADKARTDAVVEGYMDCLKNCFRLLSDNLADSQKGSWSFCDCCETCKQAVVIAERDLLEER